MSRFVLRMENPFAEAARMIEESVAKNSLSDIRIRGKKPLTHKQVDQIMAELDFKIRHAAIITAGDVIAPVARALGCMPSIIKPSDPRVVAVLAYWNQWAKNPSLLEQVTEGSVTQVCPPPKQVGHLARFASFFRRRQVDHSVHSIIVEDRTGLSKVTDLTEHAEIASSSATQLPRRQALPIVGTAIACAALIAAIYAVIVVRKNTRDIGETSKVANANKADFDAFKGQSALNFGDMNLAIGQLKQDVAGLVQYRAKSEQDLRAATERAERAEKAAAESSHTTKVTAVKFMQDEVPNIARTVADAVRSALGTQNADDEGQATEAAGEAQPTTPDKPTEGTTATPAPEPEK